MAVRQMLILGAHGTDARDRVRQHALEKLHHYAGIPELPDTMRICGLGVMEPMCLQALRRVWTDGSANSANGAYAKYEFARCVFNFREARESFEIRLSEFQDGALPRFDGEEQVFQD